MSVQTATTLDASAARDPLRARRRSHPGERRAALGERGRSQGQVARQGARGAAGPRAARSAELLDRARGTRPCRRGPTPARGGAGRVLGALADRVRRLLHEPEGAQAHRLSRPGQAPPFRTRRTTTCATTCSTRSSIAAPSTSSRLPRAGAERQGRALAFNLSRNGDAAERARDRRRAPAARSRRAYLAEAGFSVVCLEQGALAERVRVPRRQARVRARLRRAMEPEPEHAPPAGRLPARDLRIADHARHVQRGRRLDRPLLRAVGAHASAGLPATQPSTGSPTTGPSPTRR